MSQTFRQTLSLIKADFEARCAYENKPLHFLRALRFCFHHSTQPVILYRWQVFFYQHHMGLIASMLKYMSSLFYTVTIDSDTDIGPGFVSLHSSFVQIGPGVKIGKHCMVVHQNSIMASPFVLLDEEASSKAPVIGDNFILGGGSCVVGNVTLGDDVKVSMNTTVDRSFPDHAVLLGVPARNIVQRKEGQSSDSAKEEGAS